MLKKNSDVRYVVAGIERRETSVAESTSGVCNNEGCTGGASSADMGGKVA
jgi:hypothetical protein